MFTATFNVAGHSKSDAIRMAILGYLYERNRHATSMRGKRGAAVRMSDLRRDLKAQLGLTQSEVVAHLRYLISEGWVEEQSQPRQISTPRGQVTSATQYFAITARGIDKIEGPSEFTHRERFADISITATGRSIVTVGDGNQIGKEFMPQGEALAELHKQIADSTELSPQSKMDAIADIDTIQSQLARSQPVRSIIAAAWQSLEPLREFASLASSITTCAGMLASIVK